MPGGPPPLPLIAYPSWLGQLLGRILGRGGYGTGGPGAPGSPSNPLTMAQAEALFKEMAGQTQIPFNWPRDGCFARAHEMRRLMEAKGIEARKAWNYGNLVVPGTGIGTVTWGWHVAPTVEVQKPGGGTQTMVIDPSLFPKPVTDADWKAKQGDTSSRLESSDGSIYLRAEGGGWTKTDDTYAITADRLEYYRIQRQIWDLGIDPDTGLPHP